MSKENRQDLKENLLTAPSGADEKQDSPDFAANADSMDRTAGRDKGFDSFTKWKSPEEQQEITLYSIFMMLNEGEADLMSSKDELRVLLKFIQPLQGPDGATKSAEERFDEAFEEFQSNNFLTYEPFCAFMGKLGLADQCEQIDRFLYRIYFRRGGCLPCMTRCCVVPFRRIRKKQVLKKLKKHLEIENQSKGVDLFMFVLAMGNVFSGLAQLFDFYSDLLVLYIIYLAGFKDENLNSENDYQIALFVCFISIAATFMAQQSCIIGIKFSQGDFEPKSFREQPCLANFFNVMLLTFSGAFLLVPIELLDNLCKILKLPGLLIGGAPGVEKINNCFIYIKNKITKLNAYQLSSLEQQRKVTALLFENLPFTLLVFAIKFKFLNCHELSDGKSSWAVNVSLLSTFLQVFMTVGMTYIESRWLKEPTLSYLMTKMSANNKWIPYVHMITKRDCKININFGELAVQIPYVTHVFGYYSKAPFEFSDVTLNYLLNEIKLWSSELGGQEMEQKYKMTLTAECLHQVTSNTFIHFVENFPQDVFTLDIQLDWRKFHARQEQKKLIRYNIEDGQKRAYSPTGVPLLMLCIQNETSSKTWPLKEMLHIILESGNFSVHDLIHGSPLTVALQHNCFESIQIMNGGNFDFDYEAVDQTGISFLGHLVDKIQQLDINESANSALKVFADSVFETNLDLHKEQIKNTGTIKKQISAWQYIAKSLRGQRKIAYLSEKFIEVSERQDLHNARTNGDQMTEAEKNTLFKNTVKLFLSYKSDADEAYNKLGEFLRYCNLDIFRYKDKKGNGMDWRLMRLWPENYGKRETVMGLLYRLRPAEDEDMPQDQTNYLQKVLRNAMESRSIVQLFEASLRSSSVFFDVDTEKDIYDLTEPDVKRIAIEHVGKALVTDQTKYGHLLKNVQMRMPRVDVQTQVHNLFSDQTVLMVQLGKTNQQKKDEDDFKNEGGFQFTRRKPKTGDLRRKVCEEIQGDVTLDQMSPKQIELCGIKDESKADKRKKTCGQLMRSTFETVIEWIAAADFYTDLLVLFQLLQTEHHAWTTITLFSMLAPFFACQTPFIMFLKEQIYRDQADRFKLKFLGQIMVSPFMLLYLFMMDLVFLLNQAILVPIIFVIRIITFNSINLSCLTNTLDRSYEIMFEMQKLDVAGFRRMRTISQLTFETFIQTILQCRMLYVFRNKPNSELEVSVQAIVVSLFLALFHGLLEAIFLAMEAQASKTSFINYCIICFNGRFGWVPYNDYLTYKSTQVQQQKKQEGSLQVNQVQLDFGNITTRILCFDMQVEFNFSNDTLMSLSKTLSSFPKMSNVKHMPLIRFGSTINHVSLENLQNLLRVCEGRVQIDLQGTNLRGIYQKSKYSKLLEYQNATDMSQEDIDYLFDLKKSKLNLLLSFVLTQNEKLLGATISTNETQFSDVKKDMTLAKLACRDQDANLLELLLELESDVFKKQLGDVEDRISLSVKIMNTLDFNLWVKLSTNTTIFNPHIMAFIFQCFVRLQQDKPQLFQRSRKFWHARYGPGMPQELINDAMRFSMAHDFIKENASMYPKTIFLRQGKQFFEVETQVAYYFAAIRKKLVRAWDISDSGPTIDLQQTEGLKDRPIDISDIGVSLNDCKLLMMILSEKDHKNVLNLTDQQVQKLDYTAEKLKLDTYQWLYIGRTRIGDQTGQQIEGKFHGKYCSTSTEKELYRLDQGFNRTFDWVNNNTDVFATSLELTLPEKMSWTTYHKVEYQVPQDDTVLSCMIYQKEIAFRGFNNRYLSSNIINQDADPMKLSQMDFEARIASTSNVKPYYQIDTFVPGAKCCYVTQYFAGITSLTGLKVTLKLDFPLGTDLDEEQKKLEEQCAETYAQLQAQNEEFARMREQAAQEIEQEEDQD